MPGSFQRTQSPGPTVAFPEAAPSLAHVAASLPQRHPPRAGEKLLRGSTGREAAAAGWVSMPVACLWHGCRMRSPSPAPPVDEGSPVIRIRELPLHMA